MEGFSAFLFAYASLSLFLQTTPFPNISRLMPSPCFHEFFFGDFTHSSGYINSPFSKEEHTLQNKDLSEDVYAFVLADS